MSPRMPRVCRSPFAIVASMTASAVSRCEKRLRSIGLCAQPLHALNDTMSAIHEPTTGVLFCSLIATHWWSSVRILPYEHLDFDSDQQSSD